MPGQLPPSEFGPSTNKERDALTFEMMKHTHLLVLLFTTCACPAFSTQWQVGPSQPYTAPSQVATLVGDGDTVNIAAGTYPSDVTNWTANDLWLRGIGGMVHLESNGLAWGQKGIWVIQGDRTTVEHIEFSECSVPDQNGAGIRLEGHHLTVRHCSFHDNENGILAGTVNPSTIRIEHTEFDHNGFGDGQSHNLYINNVDSLIFRYNYSHHAHVGHELKSRAHVNVIEYNRFSNEATGDASREIDLPNGGTAFLIGNVIQQGLLAENSNLVGFGLEGLSNPTPHELYAINNTMVNERSAGSFFSMPSATAFKACNNILAGQGQFVANSFPLQTDTAGNLKEPVIALVGFVDPNNYDYHFTGDSPAQSIGIPGGTSNSGYSLVAWDEYLHPLGRTERCQHALLDAGAFESCTTTRIEHATSDPVIQVWPNPAQTAVYVSGIDRNAVIQMTDASGRAIPAHWTRHSDRIEIRTTNLLAGPYFLQINDRSMPLVIE